MNTVKKSQSMDDLLAQMPGEFPPPDLALRICQAVRVHHRRSMRARLVLSAFLALGGIWLALPAFTGWLEAISMPDSALPLVLDWIAASLSGVETMLASAVSALSLPGRVYNPLGTPAFAGMLALAISALLALDMLMPRREF